MKNENEKDNSLQTQFFNPKILHEYPLSFFLFFSLQNCCFNLYFSSSFFCFIFFDPVVLMIMSPDWTQKKKKKKKKIIKKKKKKKSVPWNQSVTFIFIFD